MSCPLEASMDNCDPKCVCRAGTCKDKAFPCDSPCPPGCTWNPDACECNCNPVFKYVKIINSQGNFSLPDGPVDDYVMTLNPPYFDEDGALLVEKYSVGVEQVWSGPCRSGHVRQCIDYQGTVGGSKTRECTFGDPWWAKFSKLTMKGNEIVDMEFKGGVRSSGGSYCNAPVGQTSYITIAIFEEQEGTN